MRHDRRHLVLAALGGFLLGIFGTLACGGEPPAAQQPPPAPTASTAVSARQPIRPEISPNTGLPYTPGILAGNTLYISGHLGRDPVTTKLVEGGIEAETRQVLANIHEVLKTAGMDFRHVTSVTAYITDFKEFEAFNKVYREHFPTDPPARATVQVAALNIGARIELQMIAVKD
jgi:2-iminobutanoate/2-iminopropanoate deaminase